MFTQNKAFSSYSVNDLEKARQFYGQTLGLAVKDTPEGGLDLTVNGVTLFVYPKPNHQPATFTVLNFFVANIDQAVADLTKLGVVFEHYDGMPIDDKGIMRGQGPLIAWFKDPAGNILSVIQEK